MPYRIHCSDRNAKVTQLADFLTTVPEEDLAGLIDEAKALLYHREFSNNNLLGRNSKLAEPHEEHLIRKARTYLDEGKPLHAFMECLSETNHGHSGFTNRTRRLYMHPLNDTERDMSEKIRQTIIDVANALTNSDPLSKDITDFMSDGWISITASYECLVMLGQDVPLDMVGKLRNLVEGCKKFAHMNSEIVQLEYRFKFHFG
jgi:hypothetical protein